MFHDGPHFLIAYIPRRWRWLRRLLVVLLVPVAIALLLPILAVMTMWETLRDIADEARACWRGYRVTRRNKRGNPIEFSAGDEGEKP